MKLNRRSFLAALTSAPIAAIAVVRARPRPDGMKALRKLINEATAEYSRQIDASFYGVPYHHSDATTGTWLGIERKK